jgi:histidinol-phosphate/aromatic aminotransferase/cobyric acid decarboxylase-like protein
MRLEDGRRQLGLRDAPLTADYGGKEAALSFLQPEVSLKEGVQQFGVHSDILKAIQEVASDSSFLESLVRYGVDTAPAIEHLRSYYGISESPGVYLSNPGSNAIINRLPDLLPPPPSLSQILVIGPTFQNILNSAERFRRDKNQEVRYMTTSTIDSFPGGLDATIDDSLEFAMERRKKRKQKRALLWYFCTPSTPKGETASPEVVERFVRFAEKRGDTVAIDMAFATDGSLVSLADKYSNAVFIGSASKIMGLPGLRLGWMIASPEIAEKHERLAQLNEVPALTGLIANKILDPELMAKNDAYVKKKTLEVKPVLVKALKEAGFHIYPTDMSVPIMLIDGGSPDFVKRLNRMDVDIVGGSGYSLTFRALEKEFGGIREGISDRHARIIVPSSVEEIPEIVERFVVARDLLSPTPNIL